MSGDGPQAGGRPWWRQAATLLTVVGLGVTLLFNTLAVRQSAQQDHEGRETAQISLLTQLNANASEGERMINETHAADKLCAPAAVPDDAMKAALHASLDYYEYLSWLFNHGRLTVTGSRDFFAPRMIDGWRLGRHLLGDEVPQRYTELARFVRDARRAKPDPSQCVS